MGSNEIQHFYTCQLTHIWHGAYIFINPVSQSRQEIMKKICNFFYSQYIKRNCNENLSLPLGHNQHSNSSAKPLTKNIRRNCTYIFAGTSLFVVILHIFSVKKTCNKFSTIGLQNNAKTDENHFWLGS